MDGELLGMACLFGGIGVSALVFGILIWTGKIKSWWLLEFNPLVPEAAAYLGIPFSITLFILTLVLFVPGLEGRRQGLCYASISLAIAFILAVWRPRWLTPKWLLWLETHHDDILPLLKKDAQQIGGRAWSARVRTQAGLEAWVAEVRRKQGLHH